MSSRDPATTELLRCTKPAKRQERTTKAPPDFKEAATDMFQPTATAPYLDGVAGWLAAVGADRDYPFQMLSGTLVRVMASAIVCACRVVEDVKGDATMRTFGGLLALVAISSGAFSQEARDTSNLAIALSQSGDVPLATTLTDLVTKASANAIHSSLETLHTLPVTNYLRNWFVAQTINPQAQAAAINKGYLTRDVEFDPRFEANVRKIAGVLGISLNSLYGRSTFGGMNVAEFGGTNSSSGRIESADDVSSDRFITLDTTTGRLSPGIPTEPPASSRVGTLVTPELELNNYRIYGGAPITMPDPFQDSVAIVGNNKICSGVVIAPDLVVTAGHCYCDGVIEEVNIGVSAFSPTDRVKVLKDQSESYRPCTEINQDISIGDVALLKLEKAVNVPFRALGGLQMVRNAASVRAVGFGHNQNNNGNVQNIGFKYQVNIVIASYQCDGMVQAGLPDQQVYRCRPFQEMVAAGLNRDTCAGDSGGPIYVFAADTKTYLVAVTSRAADQGGRCGPGGIYVLLSAPPIRAWLEARGVIFNDRE